MDPSRVSRVNYAMEETWLWPKQAHSCQPLRINRARLFYCRPSVLHPCLPQATHAEGEIWFGAEPREGPETPVTQYMFSFLFFNRRTVDNRLFLSFPTQKYHHQHLDPAAPLPTQLFVLFFAIIFQSRQGSSEIGYVDNKGGLSSIYQGEGPC